MMTQAAVEWFWPARCRCVLPGNDRFRMRVMGWGEVIFTAIGDISTARACDDAKKVTNRWMLRLEVRDKLTHSDVTCDHPIIGPLQAAGLNINTPKGPQSICPTGDWNAGSALAVK